MRLAIRTGEDEARKFRRRAKTPPTERFKRSLSGALTATDAVLARGIFTQTNDDNSPISIVNSGDIAATANNAGAFLL
jgi:hypothetical protein